MQQQNSRAHCLPLAISFSFVLASYETFKLWNIVDEQKEKVPGDEKK